MEMEKISAWMDGETGEFEARQVAVAFKQRQACCVAWSEFHLIGDIMRGEPLLRDDFSARLRELLDAEPTVLAPRGFAKYGTRQITKYALSAAASVAALGFVALLVSTTGNPLKSQNQIAAATTAQKPQTTTVAAAQKPASTQQPTVDEYLMAHQEFSPSTAMQGVAPYIRTVSDDR